MREQFVRVAAYESQGVSTFFAKGQNPKERAFYEDNVRIGEIPLVDYPELHKFGVMAILERDGEAIVLIEKPHGVLFCRQEGKEKVIRIKQSQQREIPIGREGLRIIDVKSRNQMIIKMLESLPVGANVLPAPPKLTASVELVAPK